MGLRIFSDIMAFYDDDWNGVAQGFAGQTPSRRIHCLGTLDEVGTLGP